LYQWKLNEIKFFLFIVWNFYIDLGKYQKTPDGLFHCLDGTQVIPYSSLNDDYCDCNDGSDEPGNNNSINTALI